MELLQIIVSGVLAGGLYALASSGLTLTYGVLRIVNFAHGEFMMLGMYVAVFCYQVLHVDPYLGWPLTTGAVAIMALVTYELIIKRSLAQGHNVQAFITLGLSIVLMNLALFLFGSDKRGVSSFLQGRTLDVGGILMPWDRLVSFLAAVIVCFGLWVWLQRTDYGKAIRATIQNPDAAKLMGISIDGVRRTSFVVGTGLAGLAAALFIPIYPVYPTFGFQTVLVAFVVVVLGGLGSVPGALLGGLLIGVVESLSAYFLGMEYRQLAYFVVFIFVLAMRPAGILGIKGSEQVGYK